jgi:serine/threonine-protein kinase
MTAEPLVCSHCHTPLPEAAAFCYVCGTPTPTGTADGDSTTRPSLLSAEAVIDTRKRLEKALGPHFQVGALVGRGGFAEVFAVRDLRLKRDVAVKVLSPELVVNQAMLARFRREAEAVAALRHPSIVPIYDIGESGGIAYIMMPLIQGDTLRKRLDAEGRFPFNETRRILADVSGALRVAHEAGLVHRDIKPENIMLEGPRQQVLVMDFGIAKALDPEQTGMTSSGLIVGTPHYMSPEQASGDAVDARSDQYSLAVLGYRMATGTHPFEGETTRALLYKQVFENPPPAREKVHDVPVALSDALQRGMSKDPKDRFPTIDDFAAAIAVEDTSEYIARTEKNKAQVKALAKALDARDKAETGRTTAAAPVTSRKRGPAGRIIAIATVGALVIVAVYALTRLEGDTGQAADSAAVTASTATPAAPTPAAPTQDAAPAPSQAQRQGPSAPERRATEPVAAARAGRQAAAAAPTFANCSEAVSGAAWAAALTLCQTEAEGGSSAAALVLASIYEKGQGVAADPTAAAQWYRGAAEGGSTEAAYRIAQMLEEGRGVAKNPAEAAGYYQQAARRGHAPSMRAAARQFLTGEGVRKNETEAVAWYRRAVAANDVPSMVRLGELYLAGRGVSKNEAEGTRLFTRAAEAGDADGQYALAMAYFTGRGIAKSDSLGMDWLKQAAAKGNAAAQAELARRQP